MKIRVVFSSVITVRRVLRYVVYCCSFFAINLLLLRILVENGGFSPAIASFMTLCVMTPINFVGSRLVIAPEAAEIVPRRRNQQGASP
jgi:putative flippase GtrA